MTLELQREINHYLSKHTIYFNKFSEELIHYLNITYPNLPTIKSQWFMVKNNISSLSLCNYPLCENHVKWNERNNKFDDGCCTDHNKKITSLKNFGTIHPNQNKKQLEKVKKSVQELYGVDSIAHLESTQIKRRNTNKDRYGNEEVGASKVVRDKIRQTNLEKYGVSEVMSVSKIRDKIKNTMIAKYGVEYSLSNPEIRDKMNKTNLLRYGSIFPMKDTKLQFKRRNTIIEKYDAYGANANPDVLLKFKKTLTTNYYNNKLLYNKFVKPLFDIDVYKNNNTANYRWYCNICNSEFNDPINTGHMPQCSICFPIPKENISFIKQELIDYITKEINIVVITDSMNGIDIFVPSLTLGIIFTDVYLNSEQKGKEKYYQLDKTLAAENNGIKLINIFIPEWKSNKSIVLSMIDRLLGRVSIVSTSELTYRVINSLEFKDFEYNNSIFGLDIVAKIYIGGFYNNELIIAANFSKIKDGYEIKNVVQKNGYIINGLYLKDLIFKTNIDTPIYYFINRRYNFFSESDFYVSNGFNLEGITEPTLYYSKDCSMISSANITNKTIFNFLSIDKIDTTLTIKENLECNGYKSIWDCGKFVYKMINSKN